MGVVPQVVLFQEVQVQSRFDSLVRQGCLGVGGRRSTDPVRFERPCKVQLFQSTSELLERERRWLLEESDSIVRVNAATTQKLVRQFRKRYLARRPRWCVDTEARPSRQPSINLNDIEDANDDDRPVWRRTSSCRVVVGWEEGEQGWRRRYCGEGGESPFRGGAPPRASADGEQRTSRCG